MFRSNIFWKPEKPNKYGLFELWQHVTWTQHYGSLFLFFSDFSVFYSKYQNDLERPNNSDRFYIGEKTLRSWFCCRSARRTFWNKKHCSCEWMCQYECILFITVHTVHQFFKTFLNSVFLFVLLLRVWVREWGWTAEIFMCCNSF